MLFPVIERVELSGKSIGTPYAETPMTFGCTLKQARAGHDIRLTCGGFQRKDNYPGLAPSKQAFQKYVLTLRPLLPNAYFAWKAETYSFGCSYASMSTRYNYKKGRLPAHIGPKMTAIFGCRRPIG